MNIHIGVVDKYARLHIALCIDVQVSSSSCNTSADVLSVVLEVHSEDRFRLTEMTDAAVHLFSLLRRREEICHSAVTYRHVMEVPYEQRAAFDHHIIELFAADVLKVLARVTYRDTERKLVLFHQLHRMAYFVVHAVAPASVVGFLKSFQADRRYEVLHSEHFLTEFFIDHRSVCECQELAVRVHLADFKNIFPAHRRLPAGIDIHISAQFLALPDDGIDVFEA